MELSIYLVADNSSDGITDSVRIHYPHVNIIKGTVRIFWAGGMRAAWRGALNDKNKFNYYLLVNADTLLCANALKSLFADKNAVGENSIIVGSIKDLLPETFHTAEVF